MNKAEQRELLTIISNGILLKLLEHSDQWPATWDGFELRFLLERAVSEETWAPYTSRRLNKRQKEFDKHWTTLNLY